jgi:hypothetical protein
LEAELCTGVNPLLLVTEVAVLIYTPCGTVTPLSSVMLDPLSPTLPPLMVTLLFNVIELLPVSRTDQVTDWDFTIATAVPLRLTVFIPKMGPKINWRGPPLLLELLGTTTWTAQTAGGVCVGRVAVVEVVPVNWYGGRLFL